MVEIVEVTIDHAMLSIREPMTNEWIRVNPDPVSISEALLLLNDGHWLRVDEKAKENLPAEKLQQSTLFMVSNHRSDVFLWPVATPVSDNHPAWHAMTDWVQIKQTIH